MSDKKNSDDFKKLWSNYYAKTLIKVGNYTLYDSKENEKLWKEIWDFFKNNEVKQAGSNNLKFRFK